MDFANPKVFATLKSAAPGTFFTVTTKKDGDFENWAAVDPLAAPGAAQTGSAVSKPATANTSQYETRDERNTRQRLIVRQSSLTNAVSTLSPGSRDQVLDQEAVIDLAERYTAWVFETLPLNTPLEDMPSDLPY